MELGCHEFDQKFISRLALNIKSFINGVRAKIVNNRQTLRSVVALFSSNMTSSLLGAVGGLLVARFLGPAETGLFRSFTIPLTYLTFLHLGTFDGLWRQIPFYVGKEMPDKVDELASAAGAWNLYISIVVTSGFILCAAYSLWRQDFYGVMGWLSQALSCWSVFYGGYLGATYRTLHQFVALARIQMAQAILNFGMVFLLPYLKFYGLCARSVVPAILGVWLCERNRPLKVSYRFDTKALGEVVRIGLPFSFWGSLYTSIWIATESALMLSFGGVTALGLFTVAVAMREGMNVLPMAVYQVLTPRVVSSFARDGSVRKANARSFGMTLLLTGFIIVCIFIISFLLDILVPIGIPKYVAGLPLMKVCLWFAAVQAASLPLNTLFATGRPWIYGRGVLVGLAVFPLATYLLVPALGGVLAVAVGSLLGRIARTVVAYLEIVVLTRREI